LTILLPTLADAPGPADWLADAPVLVVRHGKNERVDLPEIRPTVSQEPLLAPGPFDFPDKEKIGMGTRNTLLSISTFCMTTPPTSAPKGDMTRQFLFCVNRFSAKRSSISRMS